MRLILFVLFALFAAPAFAQETATVPLTAAEVTILTGALEAHNAERCVARSLPESCTQAQLAATGAGGGTIYPLTAAGRQAFIRAEWVRPEMLQARDALIPERDQKKWCSWWRDSATQAQRDAKCADAGLAAGCNVCP